MLRLHYQPPGTAPGTLVKREDAAQEKSEYFLMQYDLDSTYETKPESVEELFQKLDSDKVNWIDVRGLGDLDLLRALAEKFHFHRLAIEDILTSQRPKIERFHDHIFVIVDVPSEDSAGEVVITQTALFLGKDYVVTIQEDMAHDHFEPIRERLRAGRGYARERGTDYLTYAILDTVIDLMFPVLENAGDTIEELEDEMLEHPDRNTLRRLYDVKRVLLQLRRAVWPAREIFNAMLRDDTGLITPGSQFFLRDCYEHTVQIIELIENYRDITSGLMDLYLSSLGQRTNDIMRVLTVISSVFIPLTFLAGVYGMNFDTDSPFNMPELDLRFGYLYCLLLMFGISLAMVAFFKGKKWL